MPINDGAGWSSYPPRGGGHLPTGVGTNLEALA